MKLYKVVRIVYDRYARRGLERKIETEKMFIDKEEAEDYKKYLEAVHWEGGEIIELKELEIDTMFKEIESLEISIKYFSGKRYADKPYFENKIEFMRSLIKKYEEIDFSI